MKIPNVMMESIAITNQDLSLVWNAIKLARNARALGQRNAPHVTLVFN